MLPTVKLASVVIAVLLLCSCTKSPEEQLSELGLYAVVDGELMRIPERTKDSAPLDLSILPVLQKGRDHLLLYGPTPEGAMNTGFNVQKFNYGTPAYGDPTVLANYLSITPMEPVRGQSLVSYQPRPETPAGYYQLHRYIGFSDAGTHTFGVEEPRSGPIYRSIARFLGTWTDSTDDAYPMVEIAEDKFNGRFRIRVCYGRDATEGVEMIGGYSDGKLKVDGKPQSFYKREVPEFEFVSDGRLVYRHGAGPDELMKIEAEMPKVEYRRWNNRS